MARGWGWGFHLELSLMGILSSSTCGFQVNLDANIQMAQEVEHMEAIWELKKNQHSQTKGRNAHHFYSHSPARLSYDYT